MLFNRRYGPLTYHGVILSASDLDWGNPNEGFMFAPDAAFKDGTYYLYFPHRFRSMDKAGEWVLAVAINRKVHSQILGALLRVLIILILLVLSMRMEKHIFIGDLADREHLI